MKDLKRRLVGCNCRAWQLYRLARLGDINAPNVRCLISLAVNGFEHQPDPFLEALLRPLHRLAIPQAPGPKFGQWRQTKRRIVSNDAVADEVIEQASHVAAGAQVCNWHKGVSAPAPRLHAGNRGTSGQGFEMPGGGCYRRD
jgi:hypothetical protein